MAKTINTNIDDFTFHNVSINTNGLCDGFYSMNNFTFHNVSINTKRMEEMDWDLVPLHSTMFLLILRELQDRLMIAKWNRQNAAKARGAAKRYKTAKGID